jgi:hypothetical protein
METGGEHDTRVKNSANCGKLMAFAEAYRDAICFELRFDTTITPTGRCLGLATLAA